MQYNTVMYSIHSTTLYIILTLQWRYKKWHNANSSPDSILDTLTGPSLTQSAISMGGGRSKTTACNCTMSLADSREAWFQSLVINQKINSTGEALQICFSLIEGSWSRRSETFRFVHDDKLRHALTSCRSMLNLAIESEKNEDAAAAEFWWLVE